MGFEPAKTVENHYQHSNKVIKGSYSLNKVTTNVGVIEVNQYHPSSAPMSVELIFDNTGVGMLVPA